MSDTDSASADAVTSRSSSSPRDDPVRKKQKTELATFSDGKSLVIFIVGPDPNPTEFLIHKEVVCHHSDVLAAAFNSAFQEGQTQTYRLEDTTERAFKLFMQWLYSQKFMLIRTGPDFESNIEENPEAAASEDMSLVELWVLADKFGMPHLQNDALDAMDLIFCNAGEWLRIPTYRYIYENTAKDSPLRQYTLDLFIQYGTDDTLLTAEAAIPDEFKRDLAVAFMTSRRQIAPERLTVTTYHMF